MYCTFCNQACFILYIQIDNMHMMSFDLIKSGAGGGGLQKTQMGPKSEFKPFEVLFFCGPDLIMIDLNLKHDILLLTPPRMMYGPY